MKSTYMLKQEIAFDREMQFILFKGIAAIAISFALANSFLHMLAGLSF